MRGRFLVYFVCAGAPGALATLHAQAPPRPVSRAAARGRGAPRAAAARPRDPRLVRLADDAFALPPELEADALIRIAASARVTDNAWKRTLSRRLDVSSAPGSPHSVYHRQHGPRRSLPVCC